VSGWERDPESIIGTEEGERIEFKGSPYDCSSARGQLEFAKDCSAFANACGGVIILGVRTEKSECGTQDIATQLRPIPKELLTETKLRAAIQRHVYPQLELTFVRIDSAEQGKYFLLIGIAKQSERDKYYVVKGEPLSAEGEEVMYSNAVAVYRREGSHSAPWSFSEIHRHLHIGRFAMYPAREATTEHRLDILEAGVDQLLEQEIAGQGSFPKAEN
jgi:predicted HTH transcriptional regulator